MISKLEEKVENLKDERVEHQVEIDSQKEILEKIEPSYFKVKNKLESETKLLNDVNSEISYYEEIITLLKKIEEEE